AAASSSSVHSIGRTAKTRYDVCVLISGSPRVISLPSIQGGTPDDDVLVVTSAGRAALPLAAALFFEAAAPASPAASSSSESMSTSAPFALDLAACSRKRVSI